MNLYWADFLQHDAAGMEREAAFVESKPGYEDQMLNYESDTALYGGELAKARVLTRRAVESAKKDDDKEAAAVYEAQAAVREALAGYSDLAKQQARKRACFPKQPGCGGFVGDRAGHGRCFRARYTAGGRFEKALSRRHDCAVQLLAYDSRCNSTSG